MISIKTTSMNEKIIDIIKQLKNLTLIEIAELIKEIENTFAVDASAQIIGAQATAAQPSTIPETIEEKIAFDIVLTEVPTDKKIAILKIIRHATGLGLKESKEIVDNIPKLIKEAATKEDSEAIKKEIESLGGKVVLK